MILPVFVEGGDGAICSLLDLARSKDASGRGSIGRSTRCFNRVRRCFQAGDPPMRLLLDTQVSLWAVTDDLWSAAVMSFEGKSIGYSSAMLGNALRAAAVPIEKDFVTSSNQTLAPIRDQLYQLISADDEVLLSQRRAATK